MKFRRLVDSFNYAIEGIIYAVRTQRNMKIHMAVALIVLSACFFYDLSKFEILILALTITSVISAELINTAVESAIDATTNYYHPLAKVAKNTAAGAVLVMAVNAAFVGYIIFWDRMTLVTFGALTKIKNSNPYMLFIIIVIVTIITIVIKAVYGEGTPLRGGMPSGHSAIGFSVATTIALITAEPISIMLSYLMAFIIAQSRVDSDVHSVLEVLVGAIFGTLLTVFIYRIFS